MKIYEVIFNKYDDNGDWDSDYYGTCVAHDEEDAELQMRSRYDDWDTEVTVNYISDYQSDECDDWDDCFSL